MSSLRDSRQQFETDRNIGEFIGLRVACEMKAERGSSPGEQTLKHTYVRHIKVSIVYSIRDQTNLPFANTEIFEHFGSILKPFLFLFPFLVQLLQRKLSSQPPFEKQECRVVVVCRYGYETVLRANILEMGGGCNSLPPLIYHLLLPLSSIDACSSLCSLCLYKDLLKILHIQLLRRPIFT